MPHAVPARQRAGPAPIVTVLSPAERTAVDAAGAGVYSTLHRASLEEVSEVLKTQAAGMVMLSLSRCGPREAIRFGALLREHPRVPMMALVTPGERVSPQALLTLGRNGVRTVIDVRDATGWHMLRESVIAARRASFSMQVAIEDLRRMLDGATPEMLAFFDTLFLGEPPVHAVTALADRHGIHVGTLMSRFLRAGLPPVKRYLALAGLIRAALALEPKTISVSDISAGLGYSSPQSFGRHVRLQLGMSAKDFRRQYDGEGMFNAFCAELIVPVRQILLTVQPFERVVVRRRPATRESARATRAPSSPPQTESRPQPAPRVRPPRGPRA
jgi:AraC-like DNA-binding protein